MIRRPRILTGLLAFAMLFLLGGVKGSAAEQKEPYSYQITIYVGNQGTFTDSRELQIVDADNKLVTDADIIVNADRTAIVIRNLDAGCRVTFQNIQNDAVNLKDSRYYVKGIRKSGYDNSTVGIIERVNQDQDYVAAYGMKGDTVAYIVNYQDAEGRMLAPSRTFYGNVGDRPVAAYLYIEGYEPKAYNLTKTLSQNEAENVFTFLYTPVARGGATGGKATEAETAGIETAGAGMTGAETTGVETAEAETAGTAADAKTQENSAELGNEDVPKEDPQDLVDLDEENVPLAKMFGLGALEDDAVKNLVGAIVLSMAATAALMALLIIFMRRQKEIEEKRDKRR